MFVEVIGVVHSEYFWLYSFKNKQSCVKNE